MKLSEPQRRLLGKLAQSDMPYSQWRKENQMTRAALLRLGLVDWNNHPHVDEIWFITEAGRAALSEDG